MVENTDHHKLKYEIKDYLERHGWEAYVEKKIRLYSENKRAKTSRFSERDTARSRGDNLK